MYRIKIVRTFEAVREFGGKITINDKYKKFGCYIDMFSNNGLVIEIISSTAGRDSYEKDIYICRINIDSAGDISALDK